MIAIIRHRLRQDALPILLYLLTFMVMSYPFVFQLNTHLPMDNVDTHTALWQNWWVLEAVTEGYDINHSPLLFYPNGLDVTLQPRRWSSLPMWIPLYYLFDDPLAFNLTAMLGVLLKAYGMYLVGLMLFKKRIPAWVSGAFYAFSATSLQMALQQPNTGATEWIPWFMLAYMSGLSRIQQQGYSRQIVGRMILAGLLFSLNVYMNLKIALFAMLLGSGYVFLYMLWYRLWRFWVFWIAMVIFAVSALGFSLPILMPTLQSPNLEDAVGDEVIVERGGIDILSYVKADLSRPINYMQSIASMRGEQLEVQNIRGMSHVGFVSLAFALMGLLYAVRAQRSVMIWVILAGVFWALSLGLDIRFKRLAVDIGFTPYGLLEDNLIFQILKFPWRMSLLFLFPYALLVGYGLHYRLQPLTLNRLQSGLLIFTVVMLLYGTSIFPIPTRSAPRPAYINILASMPDGAVIDLPFGRHNAKYYMSIQRFHKRPMVEGMIARIPPTAHDYIKANPILDVIREDVPEQLESISIQVWRGALQSLLDDKFSYIIVHEFVPQTQTRIEYPAQWVLDYFSGYDAIYQDDEVLIYDIKSLLSG